MLAVKTSHVCRFQPQRADFSTFSLAHPRKTPRIGIQLKQLGKVPRVIITDGLLSYSFVSEGVKHLLCRFHHQQGVTRWLKKHFDEKAEIAQRKPLMKRLFQTTDKRTVKRRFEKLKTVAEELEITEWVEQTEANLPKLLPAVGSGRLPTTTNAIERFFRCFNRFYKVRSGFFSVQKYQAGTDLLSTDVSVRPTA